MNQLSPINQSIIDNYSFPIEMIPMKGRADDDPSADVHCPDRQMIIRTDTNQYLGNHSMSYRVVTHAAVIDPLQEVLDKLNINYTPQIRTYDNGAMMVAKFTSNDLTIKDPQVNDRIAFQVTCRNSYNGVWSIMIHAYGLRLVCLNGMTKPDSIANYRIKHNGHFKYNFDHMERCIDLFLSDEQRYSDWYATPVTQHDADSMFKKLTYSARPTIDGKYRNETQYNALQVLWNRYQIDIGKNKWSLFNAVTDWISNPKNVSNTEKTIVERNNKFISYMNNIEYNIFIN